MAFGSTRRSYSSGREEAERDRGFARRGPIRERFGGDPRDTVVPEHGIQGRRQQERVLHVRRELRTVDLQPIDQLAGERTRSIREQTDRTQQIVDEHGLGDIELEVPGGYPRARSSHARP